MHIAENQAQFPPLVDKDAAALLVIDAQERLVPAMETGADAVGRIAMLGQAAGVMSVPTLVTEQYPKGLGHTVPELAELAASAELVEKIEFGAGEIEAVRTWLDRIGRRQIVLTGFEAHVCVLQSAATLSQAGYTVFVVADAVSSRKSADRAAALDRLRQGGVAVVTSEMVVFEWLRAASVPGFKELSRLIR